MTLWLRDGRPATFANPIELGGGTQAIVYGFRETHDVCFKMFLRCSADLDRRIDALLHFGRRFEQRPVPLAWPQWELLDEKHQVRGIVVPRIHASALAVLFDPAQRAAAVDHPTWMTNIRAARLVAAIFALLHRERIVIGDVSLANLMVDRSGQVFLIDCDSVQFADPRNSAVYPAEHVTPEYASPESLQGSTSRLSPNHDLFGLAIIICQLLMEGDHPFEGVLATGTDPGIPHNIINGNCRLFHPERMRPVRGRLSLSILPPEVRRLARQCLVDGHARPSARPSAKAWADALERAESSLKPCGGGHANHYHASHLSECIWCRRRDRGHGEHFPGRIAGRPSPPKNTPGKSAAPFWRQVPQARYPRWSAG